MSKSSVRLIAPLFTLALLGAEARASGDGHVEPARSAAKRTSKPGCVTGAATCPAFPSGLRVERETLVEQVKALSGCADAEDEASRLRAVREVGPPELVGAALAHLILAEPSLSLHDLKNALSLLAELGSEVGPDALREVYSRSEALVARTAEGGPIASLDGPAREGFVLRQAEELRRNVVLAAVREGSPAALALLTEAARDEGRSVRLTAQRVLEAGR